MKITKIQIIIIFLVLFSFVIALYFYPQLPDTMASHWNINGEVDGYMSKCSGAFLMPLVSLFIFLLFLLIPKIDPLKKNYEKFRKYFDGFILTMILFLFYVYLLSLFWNLGYRFNMGRLMMPALGFVFFYSGVLIKNAKRNWFVGIRTPWTLSSDKVWDKTHKLGAIFYKTAGIVAFLGIFFPNYILSILIVPLIFSVIFLFFYSYFEYKKETNSS